MFIIQGLTQRGLEDTLVLDTIQSREEIIRFDVTANILGLDRMRFAVGLAMMVIRLMDNRTQGIVGYCYRLAMHRTVWRMERHYLASRMGCVRMDNRVWREMSVVHRMHRHRVERNHVSMAHYGRWQMLIRGCQRILIGQTKIGSLD